MHELNEKKRRQIVEVSLKCYKISLYIHIELRIVFHLAKVPRPQRLTTHRFVTSHMLPTPRQLLLNFRPVLQCLCQMCRLDLIATSKIRNCAR